MSIYTDCSKAARELLDEGEPFTEIDVVRTAGTNGWSSANFKAALRDANQVMGSLYRGHRVARYGPVNLPDGTRDYVRMASKVVYVNPETGPKLYQTPNGDFPMLMSSDDNINSPGRRKNTNRNDLDKWASQDISSYEVTILEDLSLGGAPAPVRPQSEPSVRIERLEADLAGALRRLEDKDEQINRLRDHRAANGDLRTEIQDLVAEFLAEFEVRIRAIEERERKRQAVYSS